MVGHEQRRVAEVLDLAGEVTPLAGAVGAAGLDAETERSSCHVPASRSTIGRERLGEGVVDDDVAHLPAFASGEQILDHLLDRADDRDRCLEGDVGGDVERGRHRCGERLAVVREVDEAGVLLDLEVVVSVAGRLADPFQLLVGGGAAQRLGGVGVLGFRRGEGWR